MSSYLPIVSMVLTGAALCYGAVTDYRDRTIPNVVPITIIACGIFSGTPWASKIFSLLAMVFALFVATKITKKTSGGGDIKVYYALAFSEGIFVLFLTLSMSIIIQPLLKPLLHETNKEIRRCCYLAPAYIIVMGSLTIISLFL